MKLIYDALIHVRFEDEIPDGASVICDYKSVCDNAIRMQLGIEADDVCEIQSTLEIK